MQYSINVRIALCIFCYVLTTIHYLVPCLRCRYKVNITAQTNKTLAYTRDDMPITLSNVTFI